MERREFLKLGGAGLLVASGVGVSSLPVHAAAVSIDLEISNTRIELIDGKRVEMLAYSGRGNGPSIGPRVPGAVLRVTEGDWITVTVRNRRLEPHGFEIGGIPASMLRMEGDSTGTVSFQAPAAGTYMYHDASHGSRHLYRMLGLHGAFIVHPRNGLSVNGTAMTPYSIDLAPTSPASKSVSTVFEAFGKTTRFPGQQWVPCPIEKEFDRQERIWIFNEIDPRFNALIRPDGISASTIADTPEAVRKNFVPRYFTINGRSGFDLQTAYDVVVKNYVGEPTLLRTMNVGLAHHATHIHGNHLLEVAHSVLTDDGFIPLMGSAATQVWGQVVLHDNIWERDTWPTWPMQIRDMILPFEAPPDIPNWEKFEKGAEEPFPLRYVMHDHCEMGTTAAGGNYPQGAVIHWQISGPVNGRRSV